MNFVLDDRNRIFISGYNGTDFTAFADMFGFDWGNTTGKPAMEPGILREIIR
jgi:hypothetical protein